MKKILNAFMISSAFSFGIAHADDPNIATKLDNISVPSNWNTLYQSTDFHDADGVSGVSKSFPPEAGEILLCVSGKHYNDDTPACTYLDPSSHNYALSPSVSYAIGISGNSVGIGIGVMYSYYDTPSILLQPIEIAPGDSSCEAFSNQGWNITNWWEYSTSAWQENTTEYFSANVSIVEDSADDKYYAELTDCKLSN